MPRPNPEPAQPSRTQSWIALLLAISLTAMGTAVIWVGFTHGTPSPAASASDPPTSVRASFAPLSVATYPAELLTMARAIATTLAPTAEPTATYTMLPTPRPLVCGRDSVMGELCEWLVTPTATPGPEICVTPVKGEDCLWRGWPRVTDES